MARSFCFRLMSMCPTGRGCFRRGGNFSPAASDDAFLEPDNRRDATCSEPKPVGILAATEEGQQPQEKLFNAQVAAISLAFIPGASRVKVPCAADLTHRFN
jgi:hypothetical protein